ncbi:type II secretion system minor pseudopilin GspK [Geomonas sp.]|uniref:type II secretion system minor pseudopilin GspK n=1 Tax=Geomonas sp. TaxID=2651584 RepID=UPI002B46FD06|nr:type II secretion system minor pseudopilin GspK [Geomonas sp.]HJV33924.1 type II secretion system minor pseudopilin GspK [Geomonas sp.]
MKPVNNERGFALVIALIVTTLLVGLLMEFVDEVVVDASHSHNFVDSQQASILSESGIDAGMKILQFSALRRTGKYSTLTEMWAKPQTQTTEAGTVTITIEEESGKLDLNSTTFANGKANDFYQLAMGRLLTKLQLSQDLYDSLADWIDNNDTPRPGGAETSYYLNQKPPCQPHNGRLDTLEELAQVKGFTPEVMGKLKPFVTVYGPDPNATSNAININTAPKEVLESLDDSLARGDLVERILDYRKTKPITALADIPGIGTLAQSLQLYVTFQGTVYRIHSEARAGDSVSVTEAVVTGIESTPKILYWREY